MTEIVKAHSKLGASGYSRWKQCPGSVRLSEGIESISSPYAEEGTRAHALAECILENKPANVDDFENEDMLDAVMVYVDFVREHMKHSKWVKLEQRFDLSNYHTGMFGTADCVAYYPDSRTLHVIDYKHGQGVAVEADSNEQLMYYAVGALHEAKVPVEKIVLTIVQPRCYHHQGPIRSWETTPGVIVEFIQDLIEDAIATEQPDAPLRPSDECRWCPAKPTCPALHQRALALAQNAFTTELSYDPAVLAHTLAGLDLVEAWAKGVRAFAYREAQLGRIPPGYKLVQKRAHRKWNSDNDQTVAMNLDRLFALGTEKTYALKLKSPAQIEKELKSKEDKETLKGLVIQESTGTTLVPDTDNRKPFKEIAADIFDVVPE